MRAGREGCDALMKWNRAAGIVFPGLTKAPRCREGYVPGGAGMIAVLMGWALSTIGRSLGVVVAAGLAGLVIYFRLPKAWLVTVALVYAGWLYSGAIYQAGEASANAIRDRAEAKEITRQANVRAKALDEAVARELARAAENEQLEQKVSRYEEALARRPDDRFRLGPNDVGELRQLQPPGSP